MALLEKIAEKKIKNFEFVEMLILYETSAGYALFKLLDDGSLEKPDDIHKHFATAEKANKA